MLIMIIDFVLLVDRCPTMPDASYAGRFSGQFGEFGERSQPGEMAWTAGGPAAAAAAATAGAAAGAGAAGPPGQPAQPARPPAAAGQQPAAANESQTYNQRNLKKWQDDMSLGELATISPVLYANRNHPELRTEYPGTAHWTQVRWAVRRTTACFVLRAMYRMQTRVIFRDENPAGSDRIM